MYTDEDLNLAVEKGIFSEPAVGEFRQLLASLRNTPAVDEENFRLIGGFNDIFIVIACSLLLFSSLWVVRSVSETLGFVVFAGLSWFLAEQFVRKRRMALPAIVLLVCFIGGVAVASFSLFPTHPKSTLIFAGTCSSIAAFFHWRRFSVPITVAVGTAAGIGLLLTLLLSLLPVLEDWILLLLFFCGLGAFCLAMYWDSSDRVRITNKSDVAFWLHLLSAPLVIHPVFFGLGVFEGNDSLVNVAVVLALYLALTAISLVVDRRAFMVSSLAYVIYALSNVIQNYGAVGFSFAFTGVFIGAALLTLSAYWQPTRALLVSRLPAVVMQYIPPVKTD